MRERGAFEQKKAGYGGLKEWLSKIMMRARIKPKDISSVTRSLEWDLEYL